ncbi:peptidoglycan-binding domain-containing protein [Leptolyngbya ohadii]|uniref:peptidoglycan-binding domain-containing protein n=1 Tax=Leptolyngbya ohadii TaxID=1962290 RepID=UPI000B59FB20|nr:peptidoglycan-binding protein [Leptolyngbya ohadii]
METFGYLQVAEEFESSDSRELVCVQNGLNLPSVPELKVSGQMMAVVAGTAGAAAVLGLSAGEAQAFPVGLGDSGPDVTYVQNLLSNAGYFSGTATGYFGGVTQSAVINFQADNGLVADGVVGSATLSELEFRPVNPGGGSGFLSFGSSGSEVTRLQNLLNSAGYFVPVTGYFGSLTENAVINFQAANGLSVDGVAGPSTLSALEGFPEVNPDPGTGSGTVRFGDSGARVTELQNLLRSAGYFFGASTGYFGPVTEDAVLRFQSASGLAADGIAGPATFGALTGFVPVNPEPTRTLRFGDSGSAVTALQQQLINRGFLAPGLATGYFGSATEAALIAYQRSVGLVADGIYGPATANSFV